MPPSVVERYVLVVEDDPALREMYVWELRAAGYSVVAVEDGVEALRRVERAPPSAVLLDLGLPYLGGRDVHQELKMNPATTHIPVVVVSGSDSSDLNPADFACIFSKPVDVDALIAAIQACMQPGK